MVATDKLAPVTSVVVHLR